MKLITPIFIVLLIFIVLAANIGLGQSIFSFVYLIPGGDKIGHFVLMGFLSFLVNWIMKASRIRILGFDLLKGTLIVLAVVTIEEFTQIFIKFRGFSLIDLLFDYAGIILVGRLAAYLISRRDVPESLEHSDSIQKKG